MPSFTPPPGDAPVPMPTGVTICGRVLETIDLSPNCSSDGVGQQGVQVNIRAKTMLSSSQPPVLPGATLSAAWNYYGASQVSAADGSFCFPITYYGEYEVYAAANPKPGLVGKCISRQVNLTASANSIADVNMVYS